MLEGPQSSFWLEDRLSLGAHRATWGWRFDVWLRGWNRIVHRVESQPLKGVEQGLTQSDPLELEEDAGDCCVQVSGLPA